MSVDTRHRSPKVGDAARERTQPNLLDIRRWALAGLVLVLASSLVALTYRPLAGALFLSLGSQSLAKAHAGRPELIDTALTQLATARTYTPDEPLIYRRLADALLLQGHPDEAVAALEQVHRLEPRSLLVLKDLIYATIVASDIPRAQSLLGKYTGAPADLLLVGDTLFNAGDPQAALLVYNTIGQQDTRLAPLAQLRAAIVAVSLGDDAQAELLLRASGSTNPTAILQSLRDGVVLGGASPWGALLVNGQPQRLQQAPLYLFYGDGWYGPEPNTGRWVRSPAQLLVFSPAARSVGLKLLLSQIIDQNSPEGLGNQGRLQLTLNGAVVGQSLAQVWEPTVLALQLPAGWSTITLALEAGSLRPSEKLSGSSDTRELSMALVQVDLVAP